LCLLDIGTKEMKYFVKYHTEKKPHIDVIINKLAEGIHILYCDFFERYSYDALGSGEEEGWQSVFFGDENDILMEVGFQTDERAMVIGEMSKKTFHGVIIDYDLYCKIMEGEKNAD